MQFPIVIGLHRSFLLLFFLVLMHAAAAVCLVALPWSWLWRGVSLLALACSLGHALRPSRIVGLRLAARDRLECLCAGGDYAAATVLGDSTVFSRLIVLRLRIGSEARISSIVLLPDQMPADRYRLLRLWLRWHAEPTDGGAEDVF